MRPQVDEMAAPGPGRLARAEAVDQEREARPDSQPCQPFRTERDHGGQSLQISWIGLRITRWRRLDRKYHTPT